MSELKRLEATVPIMSCDNDQKPPKKKRLNLRCRAVADKDKTIEQKLQNALIDTDSSEDTEKQQSLSVKNIFKCNNLDMSFHNNVGEGDSAAKENNNSSLKSCPVCKFDFTSLDNDFSNLDSSAEINEHINKCLDGRSKTKTSNPREHCQLCQKDISNYNTVQCQQHMNRCCDKLEQTQPKSKPEETLLLCPVCGKHFKTTKSRQTHMKKCAKENNVSTHQLVQLNRQDNINSNQLITAVADSSAVPGQNNTKTNQDTLSIVKNNKRKRKANLPVKNLDDDTQLALALSASIQCGTADVRDPRGKRKKKKIENSSDVPALLLRSDDEMKKVTEARAAAILCKWVDDDDDEIQCTPALEPSSLVKKCTKESSSHAETPEVLLEEIEETDVDDTAESCDSPVIEVRGRSSSKREEKCGCEKEFEFHGTATTQTEGSKQCFTIDTENRLWNLASLRADVITHNGFYVPNLLPKSTPRKKKTIKSSNLITNEEHRVNCTTVDKDIKDLNEGSPFKVSSQNDELTKSQQNDIEELVELINDENYDKNTADNEKEENEKIDQTWFPSSGFCVHKDIHVTEEQNKEDVDTLLNDLSCMVGNPLLSDVEIVAKDNKKFCAHSFMLSARCSTLAEILHAREKCFKDGDSNGLVRLELLNIDVRAVRAVVTYLYTAYFIPVVENVIEDVKKLAHRWNLNCKVDQWDVIRDVAGKNREDNVERQNDDEGNLDVLLKSLWEGEEEIVSDNNEDENMFGDSILDDELGDMEIKIYTQATPEKKSLESNQQSAVVLDFDSDCVFSFNDKATALRNRKTTEIHCSDGKQRNVEANVVESEDRPLIQSSDDAYRCITEPALKLSQSFSSGKNKPRKNESCASGGPDDANIAQFSSQDLSSPITRESNGDNHINLSPILLASPSSPVEIMTSPERSPLPDNLEDFDMECEFNNLNSPSVNEDSDSPLNTCISIVSPESRVATPPVSGINTSDDRTSANENKSSRLKRGNSTLVNQTAVREQRPTRNNLSNKNENDSLSDLFANSFDCKTEDSPSSTIKCNIDSLSDIDIFILSPKSVPASPSLPTSNSKDKEIGSKESDSRLFKADSDQKNRSPNVLNSSHGAQDHCYDDNIATNTNIIETPRGQPYEADSWLNDSPFKIKSTPSPEVQNNTQKDYCNDTPMTPNASDKAVSCLDDSLMNSNNKSKLEAQNNDENLCDDEQFIDFYDDGGFNCDLDDYFSYDAYSSEQDDKVVSKGEKPGTSCSTAVDTMESNHDKQKVIENAKEENVMGDVQTKENKKENTSIGTKKGNKKAARKPEKVAAKQTKKQNNPQLEFKLRDPRTPMLDYSNMATPELKGELKQYGVRPLAKRKMVVKLKEIYNYTHRETHYGKESDEDNVENKSEDKQTSEDEETESCSEDTNPQQGSTPSSDSEHNWYEEEQPSEELEMLSQPLSISEVLEAINGNGIRCSAEQLKNFFDEQCITYSEPRPARVQRKGRRGKNKLKKA